MYFYQQHIRIFMEIFLMAQKILTIKEKIGKFNHVKIRHFCSSKNVIKIQKSERILKRYLLHK